jgi:hypothetical protein
MRPSLSQHCWVSLRKQTHRINSSPPDVVALVCTVSITSRASMMYYAHHCQVNMSFISSARSQKSLPKSISSRVPQSNLGRAVQKNVSSRVPQSPILSGAPSPSPSHRGRTGHPGHNENLGEATRGRRVSGSES